MVVCTSYKVSVSAWLGSHTVVQAAADTKGYYEEVTIASNMNTALQQYPDLLSGYAVVADELRAGDCSIHNGRVMHAAGPNMTAHPRRAMTIQMMPTHCTFNGKQNILTNEEFQSLKIGDSMDDNARNPLLAGQ
eukprot:m.21075 g.21075  ORF g.21075 m.21075 type:complete len:134 (-) comp11094_c0_seq2:73-474(-)